MERVNGMPILVKITNIIEDKRWLGSKLEVGKNYEMNQSTFEWLMTEHPNCVEEIKMTQEDWIRRGTERALKCKATIEDMEKKGVKFESNYIGVIPHKDSLVDGSGYGGGLTDAYNKTKYLEQDVLKYLSKTPKKNIVKGMPIRIVVTKKIVDEKLQNKIIEPGTIIDLNINDFEYFNTNLQGYFDEIEMTQEDWIQLATNSAKQSQKRIYELEQLYGTKFESHFISVIPYGDSLVDGSGYSGLSDAYDKTKYLEHDIESFEKKCIESLSKGSTMHV